MSVYTIISEAKRNIEFLYPSIPHKQIRNQIGISVGQYEAVRYFNSVSVASNMADEDIHKLEQFNAECESERTPPQKEISVDIQIEETTPFQTPYSNSELMVALDQLGKAIDRIRSFGYIIGVNIYKIPKENDKSRTEISERKT